MRRRTSPSFSAGIGARRSRSCRPWACRPGATSDGSGGSWRSLTGDANVEDQIPLIACPLQDSRLVVVRAGSRFQDERVEPPAPLSRGTRPASGSAPRSSGADPSPPRAPRASAGTGSTNRAAGRARPARRSPACGNSSRCRSRAAPRPRAGECPRARCRPRRPAARATAAAQPPPAPPVQRAGSATRAPAVSARGDATPGIAGNATDCGGHQRAVLQPRIQARRRRRPFLHPFVHRQQQRPHRPPVVDGVVILLAVGDVRRETGSANAACRR